MKIDGKKANKKRCGADTFESYLIWLLHPSDRDQKKQVFFFDFWAQSIFEKKTHKRTLLVTRPGPTLGYMLTTTTHSSQPRS